jgi:hypothetical protein
MPVRPEGTSDDERVADDAPRPVQCREAEAKPEMAGSAATPAPRRGEKTETGSPCHDGGSRPGGEGPIAAAGRYCEETPLRSVVRSRGGGGPLPLSRSLSPL